MKKTTNFIFPGIALTILLIVLTSQAVNNDGLGVGPDGIAKNVVNGVEYYMVPKGSIVMWSGAITAIPPGWALCNGINGTPDLQDRFICSVAAGQNPGEVGGSNDITLNVNQLPGHTHNNGSLTAGGDGVHNHRINDPSHWHQGRFSTEGEGHAGNLEWCGPEGSVENYYGPVVAAYTGVTIYQNEGSHTHPISGSTGSAGSGTPVNIRPAYYKLAFIMKL
jgi:hypothetical protein